VGEDGFFLKKKKTKMARKYARMAAQRIARAAAFSSLGRTQRIS